MSVTSHASESLYQGDALLDKIQYVYIAATFDTKGDEAHYVANLIKATGLPVRLVDLSTRPHADRSANISAQTVASFHPLGAEAVFNNDRSSSIIAMSLAFENYIATRQDLSSLLGLGGSRGSALIIPAMQHLAIGIPKLIVSTMASTNTLTYLASNDINILYPIADIAGLNRISRQILANAAHSIAGAVKYHLPPGVDQKPAIGLTMFGVTTPCVKQLSEQLTEYFDCLVFHANGSGGMSMEKLVTSHLLDAVFDITTTEIADLLFGGVLSCKLTRLDAISKSKIPYFGSCGALDMVNFGPPHTIPERYKNRLFHVHTPQITLIRTSPEENYQLGEWIGNKLNACHGPAYFFLPEGGFSALDAPDRPFWQPNCNQALFDALHKTVKQTNNRRLLSVPYHINDPRFAEIVLTEFKQCSSGQAITGNCVQ